jgi:hypothetical protein
MRVEDRETPRPWAKLVVSPAPWFLALPTGAESPRLRLSKGGLDTVPGSWYDHVVHIRKGKMAQVMLAGGEVGGEVFALLLVSYLTYLFFSKVVLFLVSSLLVFL